MFTVLIDQIENLTNSSTQSYCVVQVNVLNEIFQFNERKSIDKNRFKWSFNIIASANFILLLHMYQMLFAPRLSTTPTWIVCLTYQHEVLIRCAMFCQTGPPGLVDYLAPLWEYGRKVSFPKTMTNCPIHESYWEQTILRLPICAPIH